MTPPYPLLWLRYSAFIPLYPLGVASELTMASLALPVIRVKRPLTLDMPNSLNWGFDYYYFCWLAIACYLPGDSWDLQNEDTHCAQVQFALHFGRRCLLTAGHHSVSGKSMLICSRVGKC